MTADNAADEALTVPQETHVLPVRRGRIEVVGEAKSFPVDAERLLIGRSQRCGIVLDDPSVSKVHAEVQATPRGVRLVDLRSLNGTAIGSVAISEVYLTDACEFRCGTRRLRLVPEPLHEVQVTAPERFGGLVGTTPEMIALFAKLQKYAPTSLSVVIHGETGTGKERVAQAIHQASPRRNRRFVAFNCAAVADTLLEAELFGHVKGAFTGADRARDGLFVEADGGTLLFDEVGEMSSAMQAKLLRVLENHEVRPVGSGRSRKVDVRVLFATHVDLRHAINQERFREDLYYRMAEVIVEIPPLRRRLDDLPVIVDDLLTQLGRPEVKVDEAGLSALAAHAWPGNVRQLRTVVQAALVETEGGRLMLERALAETSSGTKRERPSERYDHARMDFERRYYTALHARYAGNVSQIARASGRQRSTVSKALRDLGLREGPESGDGT